jgi:hypothetical protein
MFREDDAVETFIDPFVMHDYHVVWPCSFLIWKLGTGDPTVLSHTSLTHNSNSKHMLHLTHPTLFRYEMRTSLIQPTTLPLVMDGGLLLLLLGAPASFATKLGVSR